jgi:hypothetical protein
LNQYNISYIIVIIPILKDFDCNTMSGSGRIPDWVLSKRSRTRNFRHQYSSCDENNKSSSLTTVALVAATAVAAYAGYELNRSVQEHGWEGTMRLIWEGDPYDPDLRDAVDKLEDAEFDLQATYRIDDRLVGLEESLDAATAMASSSASTTTTTIDSLWNQAWMDHPANLSSSNNNGGSGGDNPLTIERTLADMSSRLDKIAARVDGVILSSTLTSSVNNNKAGNSCTSNIFLAQQVKERKKKLSRAIVSDMERCDALVASYQVLRERTN